MTRKKAVTELLKARRAGSVGPPADMMPAVYRELRSIARSYFRRERRDHTLQPTALVHEAYMRLVEQTGLELRSRSHFVGLVAHLMRQVLVEHARRRNAAKRGGKAPKVTLSGVGSASKPDLELVALDEALADLEEMDRAKARLIELRFFGGLSIDEAAEEVGISRRTAVREWRRARAWLHSRLVAAPEPGSLG